MTCPTTTSALSGATPANTSARKSSGTRLKKKPLKPKTNKKLDDYLADYREKLEAGVSLREIAEPIEDIAGELIPFFGPQVGWGLYRETATLLGDTCTECRDNPVEGRSVCMGCLQSNRDGEIAAIRAREE